MAAARLVALFRNCMDSLKSILTSQEFGAEYELLCTELSLQCLRFHLWGNSVGMDEGNNRLPTSTINRQDLQPTFDEVVGSIKYLLDEVEQLRKKYQLNPLPSAEKGSKDDVKSLRSSKSLGTLSSLRSSVTLRHRIRKNQKQKSFLVITKWTICDERRFYEKVRKLKGLIDGLEDITKAAGLSLLEADRAHSNSALQEEEPPPYSASGPFPQRSDFRLEAMYQSLAPEPALPAFNTISDASILILAEYVLIMKRFLCGWPDISWIDRSTARNKIHSLSLAQLQDLTEDVHDELFRRQQHDGHGPEWLPPNPFLHSKRNEARKKLATLHVVRFPQLVADVVLDFERRFPNYQGRGSLSSHTDISLLDTSFPNDGLRRYRWGVCPPSNAPLPLQYRAIQRYTNPDPAFLAPIVRPPVPTSTFCQSQARSRTANPRTLRNPPQTNVPNILESLEGMQWPIDRVLLWLESNGFSNEWQETFKVLNISGPAFLDLGRSSRGGSGNFSTMHQQVYPQLAAICSKSANGWDQAKERAEGKRLRKLIRRGLFTMNDPLIPQASPSNPVRSSSNGSVEIFKSFRVSMQDPTWKVLPAALKKYNIDAPWEQYALYIVYGAYERRLDGDEKPLIIFKALDKEGKKPMFMLRKIAPAVTPVIPSEETPAESV